MLTELRAVRRSEPPVPEASRAQALAVMGEMTAGVAHDLNNLLTALMVDIESAFAGASAKGLRHLMSALAAAETGAALVRRLLAMSHGESLAPSVIDVNETLLSMQPLLAAALGPQIELELALTREGCAALLDKAQLECAVLNLALNAREAMPRGALRISTETADACALRAPDIDAEKIVVIAVADRGRGMPPALAARAVEPFFSTKPRDEGTGLGLSMVSAFVTQSGGRMDIASQSGVGTVVRLYLPLLDGGGATRGLDG